MLNDPEPTVEEARALRRAFTRYLVRVDEGAVEGERLLRGVVPRASLPQLADRVIGRLVDAGLLMTRNGTIELTHERLIDNWPKLPLKMWLAQDPHRRRVRAPLKVLSTCDNSTIEQIQNINAFHGRQPPATAQIEAELAELRDTYGVSYSNSREILITVARTGYDWDLQKKIAHLAVGMAAWNKSCGGKC